MDGKVIQARRGVRPDVPKVEIMVEFPNSATTQEIEADINGGSPDGVLLEDVYD